MNSDVVVTKQDAGKEVSLFVGEFLSLKVQDISTTGYRWQLTPVDESVLKLVGEDLHRYPGVGAGGLRTYRFQAIAPGSVTITLTLKRPWEKEPLEEFSIRARVEPAFHSR